MNLWITDPKTKESSVSLTLMVISFVALLGASTLHISKLTENTSSLTELFVTTAGLYFGRRFQTKSGNSIDPKSEETK
jgi:hypothetical protein